MTAAWEDVPLFGEPPELEEKIGPSARQTDPDTARKAMLDYGRARKGQRHQVFDCLVDSGKYGRGKTADEIVLELGTRHDVTSRRLTDLKQMGLIYASEGRRLTSAGRYAIVWCVEPDWLDRALDARLRSPHV